MNPIDYHHSTGAPNPLARTTTKTSADISIVVPGKSKKPTDKTAQQNQIEQKKQKPPQVLTIADKNTRAQEVETMRKLIAVGAYTVDFGKLATAMIKKHTIL